LPEEPNIARSGDECSNAHGVLSGVARWIILIADGAMRRLVLNGCGGFRAALDFGQ
jgi:hypothetical protein